MGRLGDSLVDLVLPTIVLAMAAGLAHGQSVEERRQLRFTESARLFDTAKVEEWVAHDLPAELGLGPHESLAVASPATRIGGWSVFGITRSIYGLPLVHQDLRLLLDPQHRPVALLGPLRAWNPPPPPAQKQGKPAARGAIAKWADSDARLVYWPDEGILRLSYEVAGAAVAESHRIERLIVAARTGAVLARVPLIHSALRREVYDFEAACRSARVRRPMNERKSRRLLATTLQRHLHRDERSQLASNVQVDSLFDLLEDFHDFLESVLGMDSFDGQGAVLRSVASVRFHPAKPMLPQCVGVAFNAWWLEREHIALFPPEVARFPEFVGHEFGHALISSGSRLLYRNQSGALNEAIADAIGVAFRAWLTTGGRFEARLPTDIWQLRGSLGVIRDMQDPRRSGKLPNHYSDYRFLGKTDYGGVHTNSSIINQGFYLLAAGGRHPEYPTGPQVSPIGLAKAVNIFARAGFNILVPNADFRDARYAFAHAAEILYGSASPEWVATHTAMDAVGIPGGWEVPPPSGTTPSSTVEDDHAPPPPATEPDEASERNTPPSSDSDQPIPPADSPDPEPPSPEAPQKEPRRLPPPASEVGPDEVTAEDESAPSNDSDQPTPRTDITKAELPGPADPGRDAPSFPPAMPEAGPDQETERRTPTSPGKTDPVPLPSEVVDAEPPSPDGPVEDSSRILALFALAIILALVAALLLARSRLRPPQAAVAGRAATPDGGSRQGSTAPMSTSGSLGILKSMDGREAISLARTVLESPEGLVIGRAPDLCHVQINDRRVSRRHLRCRRAGGVLWIEDLNSTAGTRVGPTQAKPFVPVPMPPGAVLDIAGHKFSLIPATEPRKH